MSRIPKVVLLLESSRASGRALLKGIADFAHHHGPWSFFWEPGGLESAKPLLKSLEADGVIMRDGENLDDVLKLGVPVVVVGHKRNEISNAVNVITDSAHIGQMGADHLMQCGFKQFAFVGVCSSSNETATWSQVREECFSRRLLERGFSSQNYLLQPTSKQNWANERNALVAWLQSLPKPVGIMACNDDCGVQVMEACKIAGIVVPDLVGVVGVDNDEIVCGLANPAMSSVAINFERAGYEAAEVIHQLMQSKKAHGSQRISVPATHVVTRRSTDFVAVSDVALGRALRFIRDNSRSAVGVNDVSKAAGLSRRALERRFRSELGVSILEQIRKARTEQICRMLVETSLPIGRIAEALGFEDVQHFARYFRSDRDMSPLAYRKSFGKQTLSQVPQNTA